MIQLHQGIEKSQQGLTVENQSPCVTLHLRVNHFLAILPPQAILVLLEGHQTPVPKRPILIIKAHLRPRKIQAPFWKDTSPPSSVVMTCDDHAFISAKSLPSPHHIQGQEVCIHRHTLVVQIFHQRFDASTILEMV